MEEYSFEISEEYMYESYKNELWLKFDHKATINLYK